MSDRVFDWVDPHNGQVVRTGTYKEYMRSRLWAWRANRARRDAYGYCSVCRRPPMGSRAPKRDVHHLTYERLGNELPEDLQVLCRQCHDAAHGRT